MSINKNLALLCPDLPCLALPYQLFKQSLRNQLDFPVIKDSLFLSAHVVYISGQKCLSNWVTMAIHLMTTTILCLGILFKCFGYHLAIEM